MITLTVSEFLDILESQATQDSTVLCWDFDCCAVTMLGSKLRNMTSARCFFLRALLVFVCALSEREHRLWQG
jgi:hypothetical protein